MRASHVSLRASGLPRALPLAGARVASCYAAAVRLELAGRRRIVVLTGAGISVASGLPTYRGEEGLWTSSPELAALAAAAPASVDPATTWRNFASMRRAVLDAEPNAGHLALARLERALASDATLTIITQNVDGLHRRAGNHRVIELHGTLLRSRCSASACTLEPFDDTRTASEPPPCPRCGAPLRPELVLFDEPLPARAEWDSKRALRECDLFIAVGTSGTVSPAASFVRSAAYVGARTLLVNLDPAPDDAGFDQQFIGRAETLLPELLG